MASESVNPLLVEKIREIVEAADARQGSNLEAAPQLILDDETLDRIKDALSWAIMAKHELDELTLRIEQAATAGWPASALVKGEMLPRPVDMDSYEAAELIMLVGMQQRHAAKQEARA